MYVGMKSRKRISKQAANVMLSAKTRLYQRRARRSFDLISEYAPLRPIAIVGQIPWIFSEDKIVLRYRC